MAILFLSYIYFSQPFEFRIITPEIWKLLGYGNIHYFHANQKHRCIAVLTHDGCNVLGTEQRYGIYAYSVLMLLGGLYCVSTFCSNANFSPVVISPHWAWGAYGIQCATACI